MVYVDWNNRRKDIAMMNVVVQKSAGVSCCAHKRAYSSLK
jgi:hypothetical protein